MALEGRRLPLIQWGYFDVSDERVDLATIERVGGRELVQSRSESMHLPEHVRRT